MAERLLDVGLRGAARPPAIDSRATRAALLDLFYPAPGDIWTTHQEYDRYHHHDLVRRPGAELEHERQRLGLRLLLDDTPDAWLVQRLTGLDQALAHAR